MKKDWREPPNLAPLFIALDHHRVRYVLFGTVGLIAYGARLPPGDLDICPAPDMNNLHCLAAFLTEIQAKPHSALNTLDREKAEQWRPNPFILDTFDSLFQTTLGELDVVPFPYGPHGKRDRFTYESLCRQAVTKTAFGVHIPVAAFEDVVASKLSAHREKDLRTLPEIERLQGERAQGKETGWPLVEVASS